jgi:hypothetical protein
MTATDSSTKSRYGTRDVRLHRWTTPEALMIIAGSKKFIAAAFASEEELELIVQANAEYIFGPDIEGVLRHCTDMEVEKQYTDSHGQSEVAFAFCRLLGFELLPRLKAIPTQRLYRPDDSVLYPKLAPVLSRTINWELIPQYDQMVKYATAMRLGTADTEGILRRFRSDVKHPVYRALAQLGKAIKTIFLYRYLDSMELRREINEGLTLSRTGIAPTTSSTLAKAAKWPRTASTIRKSACSPCTWSSCPSST